MNDERYLLISSDGHAGPPAELYRDYLDPGFREAFDEHQDQLAALREQMPRDETFRKEWEAKTGDGGLTAAYDSVARNETLDAEGVAAEVLFPDADVLGTGRLASSPFGSGLGSPVPSSPAQVLAGAKAHNRWLADSCGEEPNRRMGVAVLPVTADVDGCVQEIHDVAGFGLKGVMIPTRWFEQPPYHDPRYDRIWSALEETGLVLHTHSGAGPTEFFEGRGGMAIYATEAYWWAARPLWVLLWSGVFERHPTLRYVIAENGAWWVPDVVSKMDEKYLGGHNTKKMGNVFREHLAMKPSEYVDRSCFFAASAPGVEDIARRHEIGIGNLLWGNDFPHPEGTFPYTRDMVRQRFHDVDPGETARILGRNAVELYGIDTAALAPLVDRIGPRVADVHSSTPIAAVPA